MAELSDGYRSHLADVAPGALELIDAQAARIVEIDAKRAKARQRCAELEAQVVAAETVSKAEYLAMVKQRDDLREERKEARILLEDALGWLRTLEDSDGEDAPDELVQLIGAIEAL